MAQSAGAAGYGVGRPAWTTDEGGATHGATAGRGTVPEAEGGGATAGRAEETGERSFWNVSFVLQDFPYCLYV